MTNDRYDPSSFFCILKPPAVLVVPKSFSFAQIIYPSEAKTSLPPAAQMNEVEALPQMMLQQVANDVMLRINDVALLANGVVAVRSDC